MKKIKVLHFTIAKSKGGRTQYILNSWKAIDKNRFLFDFVTFSESLDFERDLIEDGCKVYHISCYYKDNPDQFIKEFDGILKNGYDVIHIHTSYWEDAIVEERAKAIGIPKIIVHAHNTGISKAVDREQAMLKSSLHYQMRSKIDFGIPTDFCACSVEAANWLYGDRVQSDRITILHNAIETTKFAYNASVRKRLREELGINMDTCVLAIVGRLVYQKNQEFIIRLLPNLKSKGCVKLLLVGGGEKENELFDLAKKSGAESDVIFLGYRNDVSEIYQAIDVLCMPSRYEGLPLTLIEAQCSNLICLVSEYVSRDANIIDRVRNLPLIEETWLDCIDALVNSKEYLDRRTREEIMNSGYDINLQIKELEQLYEA